jgi:hemerythrin-like domain-containing protein
MLFKAVKARSRDADAIIERLEKQHEAGAGAIRALEQTLLRWEMAGNGHAERAAFTDAAAVYVGRYREHMRIEEEELMPLAARVLTAADWAQIESAFADHRDPLHGTTADAEATLMYQRILNLAPEPIGLARPLS